MSSFSSFFDGVVERAGVEDVAVLVDLDEGRPLVVGGPFEHIGQVLDVDVDRAGDERRLGADRDAERIHRAVDRAVSACSWSLARRGWSGEYWPLVSP